MINCKKIFYLAVLLVSSFFYIGSCYANGNYGKTLSKTEKENLCSQIKSQAGTIKEDPSQGQPIIPVEVFQNLYHATHEINDKVSTLLVVGHSLMCHAVHAGKINITVDGVNIKLFDCPDISVWLTGAIIYVVGFMMSMSITFYVADIALKLGFAVLMLPIGVALWPFPYTKDKLTILISIIAKTAAIFAFLAITVSYTLNLIDAAFATQLTVEDPYTEAEEQLITAMKVIGVNLTDEQIKSVLKLSAIPQTPEELHQESGIGQILYMINNNATDWISDNFTIFSTYFLILIFALLYGFKLIGATIPDYVDKFFPDKVFGKASPVHGSMTQGVDFASKTAGAAAVKAGKKVGGKAMEGVGNLISGKSAPIGQQMGNFAKKTSSVLTGTVGRVVMGKKASQGLQQKINSKIDEGAEHIDNSIKERKEKRQEKREAKRQERREKFNNSAVGKAYNKVNDSYQKGVQKVANTRKKIDAGFKKVTEPIKNFRDDSVKAIDNFVANQSKRRAKMRSKVNNWSKLYNRIDSGVLKSNAGDSIFKRAGKASLRGIIKAPIKVVDVTHRAVNGAATIGLNTLTIAGGEAAKGLIKGTTKIVETPIKLVSGVVQAPVALVEGTMRLANVRQNANHAKKYAKKMFQATGEVLSQTGRKMQDTNESYDEAERKRYEQEQWEKAKRDAGEW